MRGGAGTEPSDFSKLKFKNKAQLLEYLGRRNKFKSEQEREAYDKEELAARQQKEKNDEEVQKKKEAEAEAARDKRAKAVAWVEEKDAERLKQWNTEQCTLLQLNPVHKGLAAVFEPIYKLIFVITCVLYTGLVILAWYDFLAYWYTEAVQKTKLTQVDGRKVFIDETNDYSVIQYSTRDTSTEPYNIYYCQKIIGYVVVCIVALICAVGINVSLYFALFFWKKAKGELLDKSVKLGFDNDFIQIVLSMSVIGAGCKVLYDRYRKTYVNDTLVRIKDTREKLDTIRAFTINHLPLHNILFLNYLKTSNQAAIAQLIVDEIGPNLNPTDGTLPADVLTNVHKMLFACDLYNYFKESIPITDPMYDNIDDLFSTNGANLEVDVNRYFYYSNNIQIKQVAWQDMHTRILSILQANYTSSSSNHDSLTDYIIKDNYTDKFAIMVEPKLNGVNLKDSKMYLRTYVWTFALISTVFLVIVALVNYRCSSILTLIWQKYLLPLARSLYQRIPWPKSA
jgi:hypothetical protein